MNGLKPALTPLRTANGQSSRSQASEEPETTTAAGKALSDMDAEEFWGPPPLQAWDARSRNGSVAGLGLAADPRIRDSSVCTWSDTSASMSDAGRNGSGSTRLTSPEASPCAPPRMVAAQPAAVFQQPMPMNGTPPGWLPQACQTPGQPGPNVVMGMPISPLAPTDTPSPASSLLSQSTPGRFIHAQMQHSHHAQLMAAQQQHQQQLAFVQAHQSQAAQLAFQQAQQASFQQAMMLQMQAAQQQQQHDMHDHLRRRQSEGWSSHPASPGPAALGFAGGKLAPPGQPPSALGFHQPNGFPHGQPPIPSRQGSVSSGSSKAPRKNGNVSPRQPQNGFVTHPPPAPAAPPPQPAVERTTPQGHASEDWRLRLRQTEMEADRALLDLEYARWTIRRYEDELLAKERENQKWLSALRDRAVRAEGKLEALQGKTTEQAQEGPSSPLVKPSGASDVGEVEALPPPFELQDVQPSRESSPPGYKHPLAYMDLKSISFLEPQPWIPLPGKATAPPSHSSRGGRAGRPSRGRSPWAGRPDGRGGRRGGSHTGRDGTSDQEPNSGDDEDEVEVVLASGVGYRKAAQRKNSWREDDGQPESGEDERSSFYAGSAYDDGDDDPSVLFGDEGVLGSLPGFLSVSQRPGAKRLTAEPVDLEELSSSATEQASGLPSFSLNNPPMEDAAEVAEGPHLDESAERTPRLPQQAPLGEVATSRDVEEPVLLQAPSPQMAMASTLLAFE